MDILTQEQMAIEARKTIAKRELARRHLTNYIEYVDPKYEMTAYQWSEENKIHPQIINALERVEKWQTKRLMIFCPPRLWKSDVATIKFGTWYLGKHPEKRIIVSSYSWDLANDFGRKSKRIVESKKYQNTFPDMILADDKRQWGNWETTAWGWYYTVWVWGATTGKGANIFVIDDPVKDREQADSETIQEKTWEWYSSVVQTRLQDEDAAIILILTRWNVNDLAGKLLEEEKKGWEQREKLVIQAIDDDGNEIVWPGKWSEWYMKDKQKVIDKKDFAALYQQDPIGASDWIFKRQYFTYFRMSDFENPESFLKFEDIRFAFFVDPAFSSDIDSDDACILLLWQHKISKKIYQFDIYADTSAPSRTYDWFYAMYMRAITQWWKIEFISCEKSNRSKRQQAFVEWFKQKLVERQVYIPFYEFDPTWYWDKTNRIKFNLEPVMTQNWFAFRNDNEDRSLVRRQETQLEQFPNAKRDDIVDTMTQWVIVFRERWEKKATQDTKPQTKFNPVTWQNVVVWNKWFNVSPFQWWKRIAN